MVYIGRVLTTLWSILEQREIEQGIKRSNPFMYIIHSTISTACTLALHPVPYMISLYSIIGFEELWNYVGLSEGVQVILVPLQNTLLNVIGLLVGASFKWILIGKFEEKEFPMFGWYEVRLDIATQFMEVMESFDGNLQGSPFLVWAFRLYGAKIGRDVCIFRSKTADDNSNVGEADLLDIGDGAVISDSANFDRHTVERLGIKFAPVSIGKQCVLRDRAKLLTSEVMEK